MASQNSGLILVGCGKMGGAMLDGWLSPAAGVAAGAIAVIEPEPGATAAFRDRPGVTIHASLDTLPPDFPAGVVVFATKPQAMDRLVPAYRRLVGPDTVFLSIAAGRTLSFFATHLGAAAAVVRSMPNTPAAIGRGITVACANANVAASQRERCGRLLAAVGQVDWVDEESLIDAVTAVSGSGPAYVFLLVECLTAAGVTAGLPAALAGRLARATVEGSGELLHRATDLSAEQLRRNVTSPGGTTMAALEVLMAPDGLPALMTRAVAAATKRSRELAG